MKKLFLLIAAIPFLAHAQENKKKEAEKKIFIGFSFSPDYASRTLKNNDGSSSSNNVIDSRNKLEKGKLSFTTGFNLNIRVAKALEFQTGILYSNKGYRIPKQAADYPIQVPGQPTHFKSNTSFHYLDVPVKLNFITGKNRVKFIAGAGLAANILLSNSDIVILYYADGSEKETNQYVGVDYNNFNLSALISAGAEFKLKENIILRTEPTFRYGLLKIVDMPVTAKLWNIGLNMGVYLKLK